MVLKRYAPALVALSFVALGAACSGGEEGTALPPPATSTPTSSAGATNSSAPSEGSGSAAKLDPCSLVTKAEADELGDFDPPREQNTVTKGCYWGSPRGSEDGTMFDASVWENAGIDQVNDEGAGVEYAEMNGRKAARIPTTSGGASCIVALAIGDSQRVDVGASSKDVQSACELAEKVATVVEPKLPEG